GQLAIPGPLCRATRRQWKNGSANLIPRVNSTLARDPRHCHLGYRLSNIILGRQVKQILLWHLNPLNADYVERMLDALADSDIASSRSKCRSPILPTNNRIVWCRAIGCRLHHIWMVHGSAGRRTGTLARTTL